MQITFGKILSLLIAIGYVVVAIVAEGGVSRDLWSLLVLLFPLGLIWFADELSVFRGYVGRGGDIDEDTPAILISIMGWLFLVGMPVLFYLLGKGGGFSLCSGGRLTPMGGRVRGAGRACSR
jgi:hypothetical protein